MEECKCKPAKSYAERIIEYQEFVSLVKRMREAQKWYKCIDRHDDRGTKTKAALEKSEKESKVDKWLKEHKDETRR